MIAFNGGVLVIIEQNLFRRAFLFAIKKTQFHKDWVFCFKFFRLIVQFSVNVLLIVVIQTSMFILLLKTLFF